MTPSEADACLDGLNELALERIVNETCNENLRNAAWLKLSGTRRDFLTAIEVHRKLVRECERAGNEKAAMQHRAWAEHYASCFDDLSKSEAA
jgi:hypothetical protein